MVFCAYQETAAAPPADFQHSSNTSASASLPMVRRTGVRPFVLQVLPPSWGAKRYKTENHWLVVIPIRLELAHRMKTGTVLTGRIGPR